MSTYISCIILQKMPALPNKHVVFLTYISYVAVGSSKHYYFENKWQRSVGEDSTCHTLFNVKEGNFHSLSWVKLF